MLNEDLIKKLQELPPKYEVCFMNLELGNPVPIGEISIEKTQKYDMVIGEEYIMLD